MLKKRIQRRGKRGSMLMMTTMCFVIMIFALVIVFSFYMLLTEQQRGQSVTDNLAMSVAKEVNDSDRVGQLNNLLTLNRELVYASRLTSNTVMTSQDLYFCSPLAQQLLDEARSSAVDLEKCRQQQIDDAKTAIRFDMDKYNVNTASGAHFHLPWWQSYEPQVVQVGCGYIKSVSSNVVHNDFFQDLTQNDVQNKFVQPKSNLFMGTINAKLPSPDNDLDYYIASIAAPVQNTISPARLVNQEEFMLLSNCYQDGKFTLTKLQQIPSTLRVVAKMKVSSNKNEQDVQVGSVASCPGALPFPPAKFYGDLEDASGSGWGTAKNAWGVVK